MIDMASVYAERFKTNPDALRAAVLGQSPDPKLDPYTALNALRLVKESAMMQMAGQAQQPTSSPSILAQNLAPPTPPQGLAGMMPMGAPAGQMPQGPRPAPQTPQAPVMQASGGLAGLPTPEYDYAEGGIVAFQEGGLNRELTLPPGTPFDETESGVYNPQDLAGEGGTDDQRAQVFKNYLESRKSISDIADDDMSAEDLKKERQDYLDFLTKNAGPDIYEPANKRLKEREEARGKNTSQGQGLALLAAAGAILEGNTLARGASKAFPAFAKEMGEVQRADLAEQRSIEQMQFALADAQRKERMGDVRGAQAAAESARKLRADVNKSKLNKATALANLDARAMSALRTTSKGAGGSKLAERLADAEEAYALNPTAENKAKLNALSSAASKMKTSFSTSESGPTKASTALAPVQERIDAKVSDALLKFKQTDAAGAAYRKAVRAKDMGEVNRILKAEEDRLRGVFQKSENAASSGKGTQTPGVIKLD